MASIRTQTLEVQLSWLISDKEAVDTRDDEYEGVLDSDAIDTLSEAVKSLIDDKHIIVEISEVESKQK